MTLRWRLALTSVAVVLPLVAALAVGHRALLRRVTNNVVATLVRARFVEGPASQCDELLSHTAQTLRLPTHPGWVQVFRPNGTTIRAYAYDGVGRSRAADAPTLPADFVSRIEPETGIASWDAEHAGASARYVLVSVFADSTSCAFALGVVRVESPSLPPPPLVLVPLGITLAAILLGVGPLVRRTRALTRAVRRWRSDPAQIPLADTRGDELGELSRAFSDAAHSVAARERDLREFVENVSHDLATPLAVLQGQLSQLQEAAKPEVLRHAMNEAHYLGSLLGSLAVSVQFESGTLVDGRFELNDVVERTVSRHRAFAERLHVSLEMAVPETPVIVRGDITFTEQALTNLIGNAVRYHRPDGHVAVVLDASDSEFTLRVEDDGSGLSSDEITRVRQRGQRGDRSRTRESTGRGLGLSIVTRVAEVQGWSFSLVPADPSGLIAELRGAVLGKD